MTLKEKTAAAKDAGRVTAALDGEIRNAALRGMAQSLKTHKKSLLRENQRDLKAAEGVGLGGVLLKRLALTEEKIFDMIQGVESVAALPDPLGHRTIHRELDEGLILERFSVPIGLIGVIFESRPDALVQIASLCVKSGNALILKGGSEARNSNRILKDILYQAMLRTSGQFENSLMLVETREEIGELLALDRYIDLIIPRGSNALVRHIMEHTRIPVMGHADGICHAYLDRGCDFNKSLSLIRDSKCQYPAVCNAIETLLIHREALSILPALRENLYDVEIRGDEEVQRHIDCSPADDKDWVTEYNDLILSVKVVDSMEEAILHINRCGSGHTDLILTEDEQRARGFQKHVDSSSVMWNCSTRFSDGFRYGFGAEVGVSTGKIHARGPVGLEGLTIYKYHLRGGGHLVADYAEGRGKFSHRELP